MQEFKGNDDKVIDNEYKLFWGRGSNPENGVGNIVANCFVEKKVEVENPSDRILKAKVFIGDKV